MRIITLFFIVFMISSCGTRKENKAVQQDESIKQEYLQKGGEIANLTQSELLINVSKAMKKGGPGYAVEFCNLRAMPIKDSLSRKNNCQIMRISSKYRNPADMPQTEKEKELLKQYQLAHENGESIKPEVFLFEDRIEYYQPIILAMEACLKCHGETGKHINEETMNKIQAHYPDDLATGFELNEFRGAWKITFLKE